jgi:hypothetical protein
VGERGMGWCEERHDCGGDAGRQLNRRLFSMSRKIQQIFGLSWVHRRHWRKRCERVLGISIELEMLRLLKVHDLFLSAKAAWTLDIQASNHHLHWVLK